MAYDTPFPQDAPKALTGQTFSKPIVTYLREDVVENGVYTIGSVLKDTYIFDIVAVGGTLNVKKGDWIAKNQDIVGTATAAAVGTPARFIVFLAAPQW